MSFECDDGEACENEATFECLCEVCKRVNADERHHVCDAHFHEASARHRARVKHDPRWFPIGWEER